MSSCERASTCSSVRSAFGHAKVEVAQVATHWQDDLGAGVRHPEGRLAAEVAILLPALGAKVLDHHLQGLQASEGIGVMDGSSHRASPSLARCMRLVRAVTVRTLARGTPTMMVLSSSFGGNPASDSQ